MKILLVVADPTVEKSRSGIVIIVMVGSLSGVALVTLALARFYTARVQKEEAEEIRLKKDVRS